MQKVSRVGRQINKMLKCQKETRIFYKFCSMKDEKENEFEEEEEDVEFGSEMTTQDGFKKVSNYENVISKLSSSLSISDVLDVFQEHRYLMRNEHIALCLRMLARHVKHARKDFLSESRYQDLQIVVVEKLEEFDEFELQDLLFWMRKFRMAGIRTIHLEKHMDKIVTILKEMVLRKNYNFRHLINIYYDMTHLERTIPSIIEHIYEELEADIKLLTPFSINQLMQSMAHKKNLMSIKDYKVLDHIYKEILGMTSDLEIYQKCLLLKNIAVIHHYRPQYIQMVNMLTSDLVERLDQMQEINVISCVRAFKYLPHQTTAHLLTSIQDMIQVTIQHNNENIKSNFLMDYLLESASLPLRHRLSKEKSDVLLSELNSRLSVQQLLQRRIYMEKLARIGHSFKCQTLLLSIKDIMTKVELRSTAICMVLANNNIDINSLLATVIGRNHRLTKFQTVQLYLLTRYSNLEHANGQDEQEQQMMDEMVSNLDTDLPNYVDIFHKQEIKSHLKKPMEEIMLERALDMELADAHGYTFKLPQVLMRLVNWNNFGQVAKFIQQNHTHFQQHEQMFIRGYFQQRQPINAQFTLILDIFDRSTSITPFLRFLEDVRKNKTAHINNQVMNFNNTRKLIQVMITKLSDSSLEYNHKSILFLLKMLNDFDQNNSNTNSFQKQSLFMVFRRVLDMIKAKIIRDDVFDDLRLDDLNLLLTFRLITAQEAATILKSKSDNEQKKYREIVPDLLSIVLRSKDKDSLDLESASLDLMVSSAVEHCKKSILDNNQVNVIYGLSNLFKLPSTSYESDHQLVIKSIKDYLPLVNIRVFKKFIASIHNNNFRGQFGFRMQVIKESMGLLSHFLEKCKKEDFFALMNEFVRLDIKSAFYYNQMLVFYGNNFDNIRANEKLELLNLFAQLKINQSDIYTQTIESVLQDKPQYSQVNHILSMSNSLFIIGLTNEQVNEHIQAQKFETIKRSPIIISFLSYIQLQQFSNEQEILVKLLSHSTVQSVLKNYSQKSRNNEDIKYLDNFVTYFKLKYPEESESLTFLNELKINVFMPHVKISNQNNFVSEYLKAMNVEHEFEKEDGQNSFVPKLINIKDQNKVVMIMNRFTFNFDKESADGYFQQRLLIEKMKNPEKTIVQLNFAKMHQLNDSPLDVVNYLIDLGIESQNNQENYDFSNISQNNEGQYRKKQFKKKEEQVEQKQIDESSSSSSSESEEEEIDQELFNSKKE